MNDYAKLLLPAEVGPRLLNHPLLSFMRPVNEDTGELLGTDARCAEYGRMTFTNYPSGRTTMHGSFHKHAHGANWDEYTFTQFLETVDELCRTFDLDPHTLHLLQLEAGANLRPSLSTRNTLQAIVCHRDGNPFSAMRSWTGRSLGLELYRDQFGIKIYDKGFQYGLPFDLLRYEVKFTKAAPLHRMGIYTLNDLLNPGAWRQLQARILGIYDELFILEPSITKAPLTPSQRTFTTVATAPGYWQGLTKGQRYKARARYADIVEQFASSNLKGELREELVGKLNDLLNDAETTVEKGDPFTNILGPTIQGKGGPFHGSVNVGTGHPTDTGNDGPVTAPCTVKETRDNKGETKVEARFCLTCGHDISDQRKGSRYCSESRYGKAAKQCRNAGSNPRNNRLRSLELIERDPLLFDHRPYIAAYVAESPRITIYNRTK
jgi:hypothetical protein